MSAETRQLQLQLTRQKRVLTGQNKEKGRFGSKRPGGVVWMIAGLASGIDGVENLT